MGINLCGVSSIDFVAWRGLVYTVYILHFVCICQFLFLHPLVSALGNFFYSLFLLYLCDL